MTNYTLSSIFILITLFALEIHSKQHSITIDTIIVNSIKTDDSLCIEGKNIWVRDAPQHGKVIMKLNSGDLCAIIATGNVDTIKGCIDYWYNIKYQDTTGWVYGSQTSIKSESSKDKSLFSGQIETFLTALSLKDFKVLHKFISANEPVHCLLGSYQNDHLRTTITSDLQKTADEYYDFKNLLDAFSSVYTNRPTILYTNRLKKFEIREMHWKKGIYYQRLYNGNHYISNYEHWQLTSGVVPDKSRERLQKEFARYKLREQEVQFALIISLDDTDNQDAIAFHFYFYKRNGRWCLSGIYHPYVN